MKMPPSHFYALLWGALCCMGTASAASASCNALALNSPGYAHAIQSVRQLPEVIQWSRSQPFPVVYGESLDKQERLNDRCYWSVSVFLNRPERLELWNIFYVEADGKRLLIQDPLSGEAISLQKWRTQKGKARTA